MNLNFARRIKNFCYIAAILTAAASFVLQAQSMVLLGIAVAVVAVGIVVSVAFYRCPNCNRPLPTNESLPKNCPNCGEQLR